MLVYWSDDSLAILEPDLLKVIAESYRDFKTHRTSSLFWVYLVQLSYHRGRFHTDANERMSRIPVCQNIWEDEVPKSFPWGPKQINTWASNVSQSSRKSIQTWNLNILYRHRSVLWKFICGNDAGNEDGWLWGSFFEVPQHSVKWICDQVERLRSMLETFRWKLWMAFSKHFTDLLSK